MAINKKGFIVGLYPQQDWTVTENVDGSWQSTIVFKGGRNDRHRAPAIGQSHPYEPGLYCFAREFKFKGLELLEVKCDYMGIKQDPTAPYVQFPGGTGQDPIETHPNFESFAGTLGNELNGALFDETTGEFLGFAAGNKQGVRAYFVPNTIVNVTYYTFRTPQSRNVARIYSGQLPNIVKPPNVANWLVIGMPYETIGKLYKVTETYLGSDQRGWDSDIYRYVQ
jgi:hypothetical protein